MSLDFQDLLNRDDIIILIDLCTNHNQNIKIAESLLKLNFNHIFPKIQLFSEQTWPSEFMPLLREYNFVASIFKPEDVVRILPYKPLALKIASTESLHKELIDIAQKTDLPLIISTGGMTYDEIDRLATYAPHAYLLHCMSKYPVQAKDLILTDLSIIDGLSLHTNSSLLACVASVSAYALGASIFEFHIRPSGLKVDLDAHPDLLSSLTIEQILEIKMYLTLAKELIYNDNLDERVDRLDVLEYRKRWNEKFPSL